MNLGHDPLIGHRMVSSPPAGRMLPQPSGDPMACIHRAT